MPSAMDKSRDYLADFVTHLRYILLVWGKCGEINFNSAQILQNKIIQIWLVC